MPLTLRPCAAGCRLEAAERSGAADGDSVHGPDMEVLVNGGEGGERRRGQEAATVITLISGMKAVGRLGGEGR
jgi:hypothetical protein